MDIRYFKHRGLAALVGLTYVQIGRYEKQKSSPSSDVLQKLAEALGTSTDFLMNGSSQQIAAGKITDRNLLQLFQDVEPVSYTHLTLPTICSV